MKANLMSISHGASRAWIMVVFLFAGIACHKNSGSEDPAPGEEEVRGFFIESINPLVVKEGDELSVFGSQFTEQLTVIFGEKEIASYSLVSAKELRFQVPDLRSSQKVLLQLKNKRSEARFRVLFSGEENKSYVFSSMSASEVCEGEVFYDLNGDSKMGTKSCGSVAEPASGSASSATYQDCTGPNQSGCLATARYKTMDLYAASSMTDLTASNFEGSLASGNSFEYWDSSGNRHQSTGSSQLSSAFIKSGVNLFGVIGAYPSASYPLPSASSTADLDAATFDAKIKTASSFEYWTSAGVYQSGAGDADIDVANIKTGVTIFGATGSLTAAGLLCQHVTQANCQADSACQWASGACSVDPWNIRAGKTIASIAGQLKTSCRNRANSSIFNSDAMPPGTAGTTAGVTIDWWDTIDDYNANGAFPSSQVAAWSSDFDCNRTVWRDLTADGACDATTDDCLMQDRISGLTWSESYPATGAAPATSFSDWSTAVSRCDALSYGGYSDWRLPTQKELQDAYIHGIRDLGYKGSGTVRGAGSLDNNSAFIADVDLNYFWSASSASDSAGYAWSVNLPNGNTYAYVKTSASASQVLCVRL